MKGRLHIGVVFGGLVGLSTQGLGASVAWGQDLHAQNVLFIVADDLGVDVLQVYGEGITFAPTPTIDQLRKTGVLFRHAYSNPVCSPTRATIQTGRYSFRTGVGAVVGPGSTSGLPFSETIIPEVLDLNPSLGYHHAAIGKWHLTSDSQGGDDAPNLAGYTHFAGTMRSLDDYFNWPKTENGETVNVDLYATTDNINEAVEWINDQGESPWFMWLAFSAPHNPLHAPPDELHSYDLSDNPPSLDLYQAMVEALDTEMGRLFASIPKETLERTNVIFLGDNGTPVSVSIPPFEPLHAKGTLYDGGINVPLIISGPRVASPNTESQILVNTTDLFATALEMMGIDVDASLPPETVIDSYSLLAVIEDQPFDARLIAYAEKFNSDPTDGGQAIRNGVFKLIRFNTGIDEFYDLVLDPFETVNLLLGDLDPLQQANFDELILQLALLTGRLCKGDANGDGTVDPLDAGFVLARFGCPVGSGDPNCDAADQNGDGEVDPLDSGFVLARFGACL